MSILLLHGKNPSRRRHLERVQRYAQAQGERVLLVMKDPTWEEEFASRTVMADTVHPSEVLRAVEEAVATEPEPVRAVVTFAERLVPVAAGVASRLGLPFVSESTARTARDKYAMRQALSGAVGVGQPRFGLARSAAEAREVAQKIGYPLVGKPVIGTGSIFVRRIDDPNELTECFEQLRAGSWESAMNDPLAEQLHSEYGGALLLEEFVPGVEICVESLVHQGKTMVLAIHDKPLPTGPTFEEVYACTPTRLPAEQVAVVQEATAAVHRAMGVEVGPTHVEFRLPEGGEPVVLEAAARMGGGPIYRSVLLSAGVDLITETLELAAGREPTLSLFEQPRPVGFWNIFPRRGGKLTRIIGLDAVKSDPRVDEVAIYRDIGEYLNVPPETYQGHGHLIFTVSAVAELDAAFGELRATLRLETE